MATDLQYCFPIRPRMRFGKLSEPDPKCDRVSDLACDIYFLHSHRSTTASNANSSSLLCHGCRSD